MSTCISTWITIMVLACYCSLYAVDCQPVQVRLVGGRSGHEGLVQINMNGTWGTVCERGWDYKDALVICRQLGLPTTNVLPLPRGSFSQPSNMTATQIWLTWVQCTGSESSIAMCSHWGWGRHGCDHSEDAGVVCGDQPLQVRLVGGRSGHEGLVQINVRDTWGTVCERDWDYNDALVICRQLGLPTTNVLPFPGGSFSQPSGMTAMQIWLDSVRCTGSESSIAMCPHWGWGKHSGCDHSEDAGIVCGGQPLQVRLVGGRSGHEGLVQINVRDTWGSVCDDDWDYEDALVICRQLGLPTTNVSAHRGGRFHQPSNMTATQIWLTRVECTGSESSIAMCPHWGWGRPYKCNHSMDAGVVCGEMTTTLPSTLPFTTTPTAHRQSLLTQTLQDIYMQVSPAGCLRPGQYTKIWSRSYTRYAFV